MSKNEVGHINEPLKTKAIPTPKLLIEGLNTKLRPKSKNEMKGSEQ